MKKKILALSLTGAMLLMATACSTSSETKPVDETYKITWDQSNTAEELEEVPDYQFLPLDMSNMITYGLSISVNLDLDEDGTYTLTSENVNSYDEEETTPEEEYEAKLVAVGKYTKNGDKVSIEKPSNIEYSYHSGEKFKETDAFNGMSYSEDGVDGSWTSSDEPDLLTHVPQSTFTIKDTGKIVSWEKTGN
ncbi:MAG: hypothetical protein K6F00_01265 [Lachnospiraceae bacterium]|nr:hypothetical protein [Lachnospiraceae bacterium]